MESSEYIFNFDQSGVVRTDIGKRSCVNFIPSMFPASKRGILGNVFMFYQIMGLIIKKNMQILNILLYLRTYIRTLVQFILSNWLYSSISSGDIAAYHKQMKILTSFIQLAFINSNIMYPMRLVHSFNYKGLKIYNRGIHALFHLPWMPV